MTEKRFNVVKFLAVWILFLLLHFSYETFPGLFFQIFGEIHETIFSHMKMMFFAYVAVTLVEFLLRRREIAAPGDFLASRALIAVAYPWFGATFWFWEWVLHLHVPLFWELVYDNVMIALGIYLGIRLEEPFDQARLRPALRWMIALAFVTALVVYVAFSLDTPVHFFTMPPE